MLLTRHHRSMEHLFGDASFLVFSICLLQITHAGLTSSRVRPVDAFHGTNYAMARRTARMQATRLPRNAVSTTLHENCPSVQGWHLRAGGICP